MHYLDRHVLDGLLDLLGPEELIEITAAFVEQFNVQLNRLTQCAPESDLAEISSIAHSLKGGAGNLGAGVLSTTAANLERCARAGDAQQTAQILNGFAEIVTATIAEIRACGYLGADS